MSEILRQARYLLSETDPGRLAASRGEVAFVGRSNVGKSSFLNALCQRRSLAVVSKTPGRTRAINVYEVHHHRWIVDLPGYGYAVGTAASKASWPAMIEGYLSSRSVLRAIFLLVDSKVGPTALDLQMRDWLELQNLPYAVVGNKLDQVKPSHRLTQQRSVAEALNVPLEDIRWVSATEGIGMESMRQEITQLLTAD